MNQLQLAWKSHLKYKLEQNLYKNYFCIDSENHAQSLWHFFNFVISFQPQEHRVRHNQKNTFWKETRTDYIIRLQNSEEIENLICMLAFGASPESLMMDKIRMIGNIHELHFLRTLVHKELTLDSLKYTMWLRSNANRIRKQITLYWCDLGEARVVPISVYKPHMDLFPSRSIYSTHYITKNCTPDLIVLFMKEFIPYVKKILRIQT